MSNNSNALSRLVIAGTPFEVGRELGRFGAAAVHEHLINSSAWGRVLEWKGSHQVEVMARLTRERHPAIWSELEGLAAGLGLPVDEVFLWNCRGDVWAMAPDGCTTVQMPGNHERRIVHNEDGDPGFAGACAVAELDVQGGSRFASFVYPGSLPGHTFAVTDHGMAMTVNNLRSLHVVPGLPRMILTRALLDAPSAAAAVDMLQQAPRAGGFHLSLADRWTADLLSVEFSSHRCSVCVLQLPGLHANHAIHPTMRDLPQIITGSSGFRQIRGESMLRGAQGRAAPIDPLTILGDQENACFPILRRAADDDDNENTLATADIRIRSDGIEWAVHDDPATSSCFVMKNGHFA